MVYTVYMAYGFVLHVNESSYKQDALYHHKT